MLDIVRLAKEHDKLITFAEFICSFPNLFSDLLSLQNSITSGLDCMAVAYTVQNGKWTFSVRVRLRTGFQNMQPYRLWDTKEDASEYVDLFVWYKSVRTKSEPLVPEPHGKWFKTAVPDSSWDEIREYLSNNVDRAYAPKKRKFTTIAFSAHIKRAKRAMSNQGPPKVHQEDEDVQSPPAVPTLPQMRKKYSSLEIRQKTDVQKSVKILVENHWSKIAPTQPEELIKCLDDIGSNTDSKTKDRVIEAISQSYILAHDKKDEERKTEILSMFVLQKNM
jgi:hypothetical protein